MNLHWGKTLQNKWVKIRSRPYVNYSLPLTYNVTEIRLLSQKYYMWDNNNFTSYDGNYSSPHAHNQFLKKSRILTDMMHARVEPHSFTTVVVLASIFLFVTLTVTAAVVVFCRKRNSVFALQKSEQEDEPELELEDLHTDMDYTETDFESEVDTESMRKSTGNLNNESDYDNSPARRPLVPNMQHDSELDDSPVLNTCRRCGADPRGNYQRMVVTAVLEKPLLQECEDTGCDARTCYLEKLQRHYYGFAAVPSDGDSDHEIGPYSMSPPPIINVTYVDDPPSYYDSIQHQQQVTVDIEPTPLEPIHTHGFHEHTLKLHSDPAVVYVELPPKEKKFPTDNSPVVFVELPPKGDKFLQHTLPTSDEQRPHRSRSQGDLPSANTVSLRHVECRPPRPYSNFISTADACTSPIESELPSLEQTLQQLPNPGLSTHHEEQ